MLKKLYIPFFLFHFLLPVYGQDITGIWTGYISTNGNQLPYELAISGSGDKLSGFSLTVFTIDGVENTGVKSMKIKSKKGKVTIEDDELVTDNYSTLSKRVMLFSILSLSMADTTLVLTGKFNSRAYFDPTYKGIIYLQKKKNINETRLARRLGELNLFHTLSFVPPVVNEKDVSKTIPEKTEIPAFQIIPNTEKAVPESTTKNENSTTLKTPVTEKIQPVIPPAADLVKRKTETIETIYFSSDSLLISLYDNGQVDGDTVSVVLNGQTIIAKERLSEIAIHKTIYTPPGSNDSLQLVMYAENLGSIPPNTGLLIIREGENRYEIRFDGDFRKNSAVILKRKRGF